MGAAFATYFRPDTMYVYLRTYVHHDVSKCICTGTVTNAVRHTFSNTTHILIHDHKIMFAVLDVNQLRRIGDDLNGGMKGG